MVRIVHDGTSSRGTVYKEHEAESRRNLLSLSWLPR